MPQRPGSKYGRKDQTNRNNEQDEQNEQLFTSGQAAKYLGISLTTFNVRVAEGVIAPVEDVTSVWRRFRKDTLDAYKASWKTGGGKKARGRPKWANRADQIVALLEEDPDITQKEMATRMDCSPATMTNEIKQLISAGRLKRNKITGRLEIDVSD